MTPRPKNVTAVLRKVRDTLRVSQHLPMQVALARVNSILRGWVNYFHVGNSSHAFGKVRDHVERKVTRFAAKKTVVYKTWGLFGAYRLAYLGTKARAGRTDS